MKSLIAILALISSLIACGHSQDSLINYSMELPGLLDSLTIQEESIHIEIDKSDYILSIVADTVIIKQYPVVFGGNPVDDKLRQGDQCTPEGRLKVISKYPHGSWEKFIWIDYPTEDSWR